MRRREFVAALGSIALLPSGLVRAQQREGIRTVGIIMPYPETDTEVQDRVAALRQALQGFGWRASDNLRFEER